MDVLIHALAVMNIQAGAMKICEDVGKFPTVPCFIASTGLSAMASFGKEYIIDDKPEMMDLAGDALGWGTALNIRFTF